MIDIAKIREYTGGDDDFIKLLFDKFLNRLNDDLEELESVTASKDLQAIRSKTHAMLSSARIFFLEDIVELSAKIEQDCENGRATDINQSVDKLTTLYKHARAEILEWKSKYG